MKKKEILKSPVRQWDDTSREYKYILLIPSGTKHESGFMHIAIVGVYDQDDKEQYEICGYPDVVSYFFPIIKYGDNKEFSMATVRTDCYYPSGIMRLHGRGAFKVSEALSSMDITFQPY